MEVEGAMELKNIIQITSPVIKSLVETFVTPKLIEFREKNNVEKKISLPTEEDFLEYYHRTFKRLIVVNTLVFNNSQRLLPEIYIPLSITSTGEVTNRAKITGFPKKLSDEFGNILITDSAGMGKSTLMKTIFLDCIQKKSGIPLFIELRRLNSKKKILDEIKEQLNALNKEFNSNLLLNLLSEGGFIIILDGYDEIPLNQRDTVTTDLQEFISKASNNRFFITSRPEKALTSFGNFQEFRINPLNKKEAFELLRKYDKQGSISSLLIKKLEEKDMVNVHEFLTNPLLVSLLYTAFEHKQAIPFKKYLFYRQVYDANFESHDLTKGDSYTHEKYSKLEIDDFHRTLRHIGYNCFKLQKIEFTKDELLKLINEAKKFCVGLDFKESDFLNDILKTVPLFTQDGNYFRWSHKSLQEYFAAQFIYLDSKLKQNEILLRIFNHPNLEKFINVLDLYYDMDFRSFRNIILYDLLKDFVEYSDSSYNEINSSVDYNLIKTRIELTFFDTWFLAYTKDDPVDDDKIKDFFDENINKYRIDNNRFSGMIFDNSFSGGVFTAQSLEPKSSILSLLYNKKSKIVKNLERDSILNEKNKIKIKLSHIFSSEYESIKLTDDKSLEFNKKENFEDVNLLLIASKMFPFTLDFDNSKSLFKIIEENLKEESQNDFLTNGI